LTISYCFDRDIVSPWVCERAGGHPTQMGSAIGQMRDGILVAGVMYDEYTGSSISMHARIDSPRSITRRFWWMCFDYAFNQLGVKRVTGMVRETNARSNKLVSHLGGRIEAILSDYFPDGDGIVYIMRREDCRCLKLEASHG
jgi:hypothetical protein